MQINEYTENTKFENTEFAETTEFAESTEFAETPEFNENEFIENIENDNDNEFNDYDGDDYDGNEYVEEVLNNDYVVWGGENKLIVEVPETPPKPKSEKLTSDNMLTVLISEKSNLKKLVSHHVDSVNHFYDIGIKQILCDLFEVDGYLPNFRTQTDDDKAIESIRFNVKFTDVVLKNPTTKLYMSGTENLLWPNNARQRDSSYSGAMSISATIIATAILRNGGTLVRDGEIKNYPVATIPILVGSNRCNTHDMTRENLKNIQEDPRNPGGYFIVDGTEWCVDNIENITNNHLQIHRNFTKLEHVRGQFISKPGDAFENSYRILYKLMVDGNLVVQVTIGKFDDFEIPFYLLFRMLGIVSDKEIVESIVMGLDNPDPITKNMLQILNTAMNANHGKFNSLRNELNRNEIIKTISDLLNKDVDPNARKDSEISKYLHGGILSMVDRYILPHIGVTDAVRTRKLLYIAVQLNKVLRCHLGVLQTTDRDALNNKRIHPAGMCISKASKTNINFAIVQPIKKQLIKEFKSLQFNKVALADTVKNSIKAAEFERLMIQSITSGEKILKMSNAEVVNRVSSQMLYHKNDLNVKSTLNTINTPTGKSSKKTERASNMRRVHPSYLGYIDVSQSADTGEKVGMTKQMAITASISGPSDSKLLKKTILLDSDLTSIENIQTYQYNQFTFVYVNGDLIGGVGLGGVGARFVDKYRLLRRTNKIHPHCSIVWELTTREIHFWTDVGRPLRPLVIVYNNINEYDNNLMEGKQIEFSQYTLLTPTLISDVQCGRLSIEDLRDRGILEYISPDEQLNVFSASNIEKFYKHENDITMQFTHIDINQAIFGIVALASPLANHSNAVRITMYTNHRRQSTSWYALNWPFRVDKNTFFQYYAEMPAIKTIIDGIATPNGQNTIVALAMYSGWNQEDSGLINQSSIDRGLFNGSRFYNYKDRLDKNETFGCSDFTNVMDLKRDADYTKLDNRGLIRIGEKIKRGTVLICKISKLNKPENNFEFTDKSTIYTADEVCTVMNVILNHNADGFVIAKVVLRMSRPFSIGDKIASRSGNKGINARNVPGCDMPISEDGITPDIIINPHSIPTRMAVNQVIETCLAMLAADTGVPIDATVFKPIDLDELMIELEKRKIATKKRLYNGLTGNYIDALILMGPTSYQRLLKFVVDENYAISSGPKNALTRQPVDGKGANGGLRLGEMELWVLHGHGCPRVIHGKLNVDSDGVTAYMCRKCGYKATVNIKLNLYRCKHCKDMADIVAIDSTWVSQMVLDETRSMGIDMRCEMQPHIY